MMRHPPMPAGPPSRSVLVIDNEAMVRSVLAEVLVAEGYEVRQASSGPQGLALALSCQPDVVLLDIQMPGMDGWQVLDRLRGVMPEVPVVIMSGLDVPDEARLRGAWAFLGKPYRSRDIVDVVRAVLNEDAGAA